jgi:cytochrome oxidase assembly protein ShyY1
VLKKLMEPKWLGGLALATAFAVACYFLGQWQWSRYEEKAERNATLDRNYRAEPVAFSAVVDQDGVRPGAEWSRVELRGTYAAEHLYVRNRPNEGVYGYEILGLLQTPDAGPVVVNRGWVRNSPEGAAVLPEVPPPPSGSVTVIGWVRPFERSLDRDLPAGQVASIAAPDIATATGTDPAAAYVRAESETAGEAAVDSGLLAMEPPDRSLGPHQAYAVQWWLTMALGYAFVALGIRRELREELAERDPEAAAAAAQLRRPTKVSRWEEEDS